MRFALAVVKLFPWGGVQRDCLRLARALQDRGHEATIFTSSAEGSLPADIAVEILPARALTNHGRNRRFSDALVRAVKGRYQHVIGFDKLVGLDVLYCVDPSVSTHAHVPFLGWFPRHRTLLALEAASFAKEFSHPHHRAIAESVRRIPARLGHAGRAIYFAAAEYRRGAAAPAFTN